MSLPNRLLSDDGSAWLGTPSPASNVVVSTRVRFARNVSSHPFAPHASQGVLAEVREDLRAAFERNPFFDDFQCLELTEVSGNERAFLKESRLISKEMERGGAHRAVYISQDFQTSLMVNEEDHLRIQRLEAGLQLSCAGETLERVDTEIRKVVPYAFHERFGFLTACPTNTGTGLRAGVMMHLPGLTTKREAESLLAELPKHGLTVRGFHGENSENLGDFYQISNEVTLGKTVSDIMEVLASAVGTLLEKELEARNFLVRRAGMVVHDAVWRSYGVLRYARRIEAAESMKLLSRLRLGVDEGWFPGFTHEKLNRLMLELQPAHLVQRHGATDEPEERDVARAELIRGTLA